MTYATFNPLAIFVAAVLAFVLGGIYYGPLFGRTWERVNGYDRSEAELQRVRAAAPKAYVVSFVSFLVMSAALTVLADYIVLSSPAQALKLAILAFVGFVAPVGWIATAYAGRPWRAWLLDAGYQLLYLLAMSLVVVLWM